METGGPLRVVQVSDSHLSPRAPFADEHWDAVVAHVAATQPDLVVHTGDISAFGDVDESDLRHARRRLGELPVPWVAVPGNHDIGDMAPTTEPVDARRRARYTDVFGEARWHVPLGGWRLVGVDAQTLCSELAAAADEWSWLEAQLAPGDPVALFLHRPLRPFRSDTADDPHRYISGRHRRRLSALLTGAGVRLVATGHVHQWWAGDLDGARHVWGPSTWAALPDAIQPEIGAKAVGIVEHELHPDGTVGSVIVQPAGVRDLRIGDDFPSPYAH